MVEGHPDPPDDFHERELELVVFDSTLRALRAPILGRKNHYGSKSERGMKAEAICSSRPASSSASIRAT